MNSQAESTSRFSTAPANVAQGVAASVVRRILSRLKAGVLHVELPSGQRIDYRAGLPGVEARIVIHRWRALRRLIGGGDVGFAKAYIDGDWSSPDLTAFIELIARNGATFIDKTSGIAPFRALNFLAHLRRVNTRVGSRRNVTAHYDLGNEFYRLWLDPSMLYSSALFSRPAQSLEDAQREKVEKILQLLELAPSRNVLEIGCGWGALAVAIAKHCDADVTGITLSPSQQKYTRAEISQSDLSDRVDCKLVDYRDTTGQFDRVVSIEMIEAVGERYWPGYFATLRDRLKPQGLAVIQAITIAEDRFDAYRARPDFIQRYIFPGGFLPTRTAIREAAKVAGLDVASSLHFGASYALTLAEWRRRFNGAWPQIETLGFNSSFRRMWDYYLCYCEAGFRAGVIDVGLYVLAPVAKKAR
jgi:cyclopropane-fatty-acyl-phospholipid synthase